MIRGGRNRASASRLAIIALATFLAGGCAVGPDYVTPEVISPDQWHAELTRGLVEGDADLQTWWTVLEDPVLPGLIERAFEGSNDLEAAAARVRQARFGLGIAKGERLPEVNGTGDVQRQRRSRNESPTDRADSGTGTNSFFSLGFSANWEIDLWGRVRRSVESANASYEASVEAYRDTLVVLYADVATFYIAVRTFQDRIKFALSNVETQKGSLELTRVRRNAGLVGDLDVRQAELNLARTESIVPFLRQQLAESVHRLSVLLGLEPTALWAELQEPMPIPEPPESLLIGMPANLMRQRPDIRQAERVVAANTARIGVATAALYPAFSLSGNFTMDATSVTDLFSWDSRRFGIGPTMQWNLFAGGRVRATIGEEESRTEEALTAYEETVLRAYEDVENSMVAYVEEQNRRDALERSVIAAREAVRLVRVLYRQGLTEFQNVLDTEQLLFEQEDDYASSRGQVVNNLVNVYRSLGGGWQP